MMQELFRIPGLDIPIFGYGLMLVLGFYAGLQLMRVLARRSGIDPDIFVNVAVIALIFGIGGARLSHVLENLDVYTSPARSAWDNFVAAINIRAGGLTFFGGVLLATPACLAYGIWRKVPLRLGMDIAAPAVMLALCFGRIGCCYGAECQVPWAVHFPYHSNAYLDQYDEGRINAGPLVVQDGARTRLATVDEVKRDPDKARYAATKVPGVTKAWPVHPSQLYSAFNALLLSAVLVAFFTLQPAPGRVFALMLILKGLTRFLLEMVRTEPTVLGPLSFSMVVSIPLFIGGLVMWYVFGKMDRRRPEFEHAPARAGASPVTA